MNKIVTHSGTFHADEICGVALLLRLFPGAAVERTYTPSEDDFADPGVIVLDIGRRYEPDLSNFDHHQDAALPSAAGLILRHFYGHDPRLAALLERHFIGYIDRVDRGDIVESAGSPPTINVIVRACNNLENGFDEALRIMTAALDAQFAAAKTSIRGENLWAATEKIGSVAVRDTQEFIVGWQELAADEGINFLVSPNLRGGYEIMSRDSKLFPIPADIRQTFLHNSGFMAAYASKEDAVAHARVIQESAGRFKTAIMKPKKDNSIIFRADDHMAALVRANAKHQGRTMTDLITSALESYLSAKPGEYPDPPTVRPLPMYFMLGNPDACFYDVSVNENTVSGLFEGTARDFAGEWHTISGIEWEVSLETFLEAACQIGLLACREGRGVWTHDEGPEILGRTWAADWLTENNATEPFYKVLAEAYRTEFSHDLGVIAYRLAEFHGLPERLWDADLKTATLQLADLFRACEGWPMQGV